MERYREAQAVTYQKALNEVIDGLKQTHWIWYIFPHMQGLGKSWNAYNFGIHYKVEAEELLNHPVLGQYLREITQALLNLEGKSAYDVFGDDDIKVRSSMTLFDFISPNDIFADVLDKYYSGSRCSLTLKKLSCN